MGILSEFAFLIVNMSERERKRERGRGFHVVFLFVS